MNKVTLVGNIVKDIEISTTNNGINYTRFTLAVKRNEEKTDFINCVAWRGTAENLSKYCKKGDKIAIVGRLEVTRYETGGEKRTFVEVAIEEMEFVTYKKAETKPEQSRTELKEIQDDDLPF